MLIYGLGAGWTVFHSLKSRHTVLRYWGPIWIGDGYRPWVKLALGTVLCADSILMLISISASPC